MTEQTDNARNLRAKANRYRSAADALDHAADLLETDTGLDVLGGRELVDRLHELLRPGEEFHYKDGLERLRQNGCIPRGAVPANTLLVALTRSPYFSRAGKRRSGLFRRNAPGVVE